MKISVDSDACIGSGSCVLECSEVFDQDDEGTVVLLIEEPPSELHEPVRAAAAACPAAVIQIEE